MFAAAVLTNSVLYYTTRWFLQKPLLAPSFTIPTRRDTPAALFLGAAMFGAGWAIGGFCPGPAIVAAWEGNPRTLAFVVSMVAGMGLYRLQASVAAATAARSDDARAKAHPALSTALISVVATVSLALTAWVYYTASTSGHSAQVARNTFYLHPVRPAPSDLRQEILIACVDSGMVGSKLDSELRDFHVLHAIPSAFQRGLCTFQCICRVREPLLSCRCCACSS